MHKFLRAIGFSNIRKRDLDIILQEIIEHPEVMRITKDSDGNEFAELSKNYDQKIKIITVNNDVLKDCPIRLGDHVSIATYYRLLAPYLLPKNIEKILYIDCDIIINGNLSSLYEINIKGHPIAMSKDEAYFIEEKYTRLDYSRSYTYKNAGVALINLKHWRENDIANICLEYISKNPEKLTFHDQDTINAVLHKEIKLLPIKYNLQTGFLLTDYSKHFEKEMVEILEAAKEPVIIHYTGVSKPWYKDSKHPYTKRFLYYKSMSLWKDYPLIKNRTSIYNRFIQIRNEIIWFLGIKKRPKSYIIDKQP